LFIASVDEVNTILPPASWLEYDCESKKDIIRLRWKPSFGEINLATMDIDLSRRNKKNNLPLGYSGRTSTVVNDRIAPYTVTEIYVRNTITCITAKHSRIVNVYGRLRPYTELVTVDLGMIKYRP